MPNEIPKSNALAEAGSGSESLTELLSRDPEGYQEQDLDRIIEVLREQRARWAAVEAAGGHSRSKSKPTLATSTNLSLEDLGL